MLQQSSSSAVPPFILVPWSTKVFTWEVVSVLLLIYTAIILPPRLAFDDDHPDAWDFTSAWAVTDFLIDLFFMADVRWGGGDGSGGRDMAG